MLYRKMESTGDSLSILGFGCMRFPLKNMKINEVEASKLLYYAIDNGVNYLDTALPYHGGESEAFLGRVLKDGYRDKVKLATKLPAYAVNSREEMDHILNSQLEKLQTGHIDYYLLHDMRKAHWAKLKKLGVLEFLESALKDGRIKNAGFSFHDDLEVFKEIVDSYHWSFCQIQYNILDTNYQAGTAGLKYAASKGLGVVIMEPLRGGSLVRNLPMEVKTVWCQGAATRTPAERALRWIWNHPEVHVVLSGMSKMSELKENIITAGVALPDSLSDKEIELSGRVKEIFLSMQKVGCTNCQYCMPCPSGVNIPGCFELYNKYYLFKKSLTQKVMYLMLYGKSTEQKSALASECTECGKCEKQCPQKLPIMRLLKDVKKNMEGFLMKFIMKIAQAGMRKKALKRLAKRK